MNLLSVQGQGALYTVLLFLIVVIVVHGIKLVRIGYRSLGKKLPPAPPPKEKEEPEPVYFLVERKKKAHENGVFRTQAHSLQINTDALFSSIRAILFAARKYRA